MEARSRPTGYGKEERANHGDHDKRAFISFHLSGCTHTTIVIASLLSPSHPSPLPPLELLKMATTTTTANAQLHPPAAAPVVTPIRRDTVIALDENEVFEDEASTTRLGRSPERSALALLWEAVDESNSADNEYASLILREESEGASGAFPTFPVSSLHSTIRITSCDELIF